MKKFLPIILLFCVQHSFAQINEKGVLSSSGQTVQDFPVTVEMNYSFGTAFGKLEGAPCVEFISGVPFASAAINHNVSSTISTEDIIDCLEEFLDPVGIEPALSDHELGTLLFDPVSHSFHLSDFEDIDRGADLFVMDLNGKLISQSKLERLEGKVASGLGALPTTMFIAVIVADKKIIITRKFLINQ